MEGTDAEEASARQAGQGDLLQELAKKVVLSLGGRGLLALEPLAKDVDCHRSTSLRRAIRNRKARPSFSSS